MRWLATMLSISTILVTAPFSPAETFASSPIGSVVTAGSVTVGGVAAPTGTTIFSGDRIATPTTPALLQLSTGGRVEMTVADATFSREGETLVVEAREGLLRFHFRGGEKVRIAAGRHHFLTAGGSVHAGEIGTNKRGQVAVNLTEGVFAAVDTETGDRSEVTPDNPKVMVQKKTGQGSLTKGGKTLTDAAAVWKVDEHKNKCVVAVNEAYRITANTENVLTIKGTWKLATGTYEYRITDCDTEPLILLAGAGAAAGITSGSIAAIIVGTATAVGLGVGLTEVLKSENSR